MSKFLITGMVLFLVLINTEPVLAQNQIFEQTFVSQKKYADPFNDVDVDVVFTRSGESWRVPTFWRGGNKWTVRFAPPTPGEYTYRLESTDTSNPDLNGHQGRVTITAYTGPSPLLRHGMIRVSRNKRYFEQADGTPFYWLGDTWWDGLSDRLSWDGFQELTADRKSKGFTVVQICAGLIPSDEEVAPIDPGFHNEGGFVWDQQFKQINPRYFDYADRRIQRLVDSGIAPAIVGAWGQTLAQMGVKKMEKHWRYIIARYGAYPVFWILGGEVFDPPQDIARRFSESSFPQVEKGWTEVARYIRATDPYHHPLTVHESPPPYDYPLQDESLTDFDMFQPSHFGWPSIATEIAQLNMHYARTTITKPLVVGEIGYEDLGGRQLQDFQRVAFWLAMLNGAAGFTYGANGVWESYTADKPLHRKQWSFVTWQEGMNFPGSTEVGLGAKLLRNYSWQRFAPHPEWVTPRGTTLLEPNDKVNGFDIDLLGASIRYMLASKPVSDTDLPAGVWKQHNGNFHLPYAAGIPGEVRFIYMPYFGLLSPMPPTVLGLETGVAYHAYYWEPSVGIKFDLGAVERPAPGPLLFQDKFDESKEATWINQTGQTVRANRELQCNGSLLALTNAVNRTDLVAAVEAQAGTDAGLVLRYHDPENYVAAIYSPKDKAIYLVDRKNGVDGPILGETSVEMESTEIQLSAEVRGGLAAVSITDGRRTYTSSIVPIPNVTAGEAGLLHQEGAQSFSDFELRKSPVIPAADHLDRKLYDAWGHYRGEMIGEGLPGLGGYWGPGWSEYGKNKHILLNAYLPEGLPASGDWLLVLEARK